MSTRKTELGPLAHILRQVRRRLRGQRALDRLALCVPLSLSLLAAAVLAARLGKPWLDWALPLAIALPLLATAVALLTRVPLRRAAHALDHSHHLADRVQSALQFAAEPTPTTFMQAAIRDATGRTDQLSAQRAAPLHVPRSVRYSVPAAAALALARWLPLPAAETPETPPSALEQAARSPLLDAETRAGFEDELERWRKHAAPSEELEPFVRAYEDILERMERGEIDREEALEELAELQRSLEAARAGHESTLAMALERLTTSLANARASRDIAEALSDGELDQAAAELESLAREVEDEGLTRREREELRKALEEAAKGRSQQDEPEEPSLLKKDRPEREQTPQEPSLLKKKQQKRELERLRREQQAREGTRRKLEQLRRELDQAGRDLQGSGGQRLRNGAQRMRDLAQDGMTSEQQRKLAEQMQQLREQLQRQRQQGGGGSSSERQQGQGQGQGQGQSERLERFSLQAQGQNPGEEDTPLWMRQPGAKGGKPADAPSEAKKGDEERDEDEKKKQGKGARVLDLNGEGQPNAQLEMPGMVPDEGQTQAEQGNEPGDPRSTSPNDRLSGKLKDSQLTGTPSQGPTRSQVIYDAAQQGFATTPYTKVYTDYRSHAESVLERDEIPPGYRFYVQRYFQLIRPREGKAAQ